MKLRISKLITSLWVAIIMVLGFMDTSHAQHSANWSQNGVGCMAQLAVKDRPDKVTGEVIKYLGEMNADIGKFCWKDGNSLANIIRFQSSGWWYLYLCGAGFVPNYLGNQVQCCPVGSPISISQFYCGNSSGATVSPDKSYVVVFPSSNSIEDNLFIENPAPLYVCNSSANPDGCIIDDGTRAIIPLANSDLLQSEIVKKNYFCMRRGEIISHTGCRDSTGADDACVCINSTAISKKLYDTVSVGGNYSCLTLLDQCNFQPSEQRVACTTCMIQNCNAGIAGVGYTWSTALGCVDTRLNPFITRVIQIGLGVGSGIAILRIIQGAFMRQSGDPGKAQEGNEIIISTIMAIAVLAGVLLIFRIIGVDVLGIFTESQFQKILN